MRISGKLLLATMLIGLIAGFTGMSVHAGRFDTGSGPVYGIADIHWEMTYGGFNHDHGYSVQQTTDGGYIIAGMTQTFGAGGGDVYLIKTDAAGSEQWSQTYGGSDNDRAYSVQQTTDGGYIIVGETQSFGAGSFDIYLIKTDPSGSELWSKTFGGSSSDYGQSVQQTTDGGYIITGYTGSFGAGLLDVYLIKTDASGNEQWSRTHGGDHWDYGESVQQTTDGGYIIAGRTWSFGPTGPNIYLIKTDPSGNEQWSRTFGGSDVEYGFSVQQTTDGGYIIAGQTDSFGAGGGDVYLIKTDPSGNEQWSRTFGGSSSEWGYSVQQTSDGGYVIGGHTFSYGAGLYDFYLIKTDPSGNEEWSQTFGGTDQDYGLCVQQTTDGGYVMTGRTIPFYTDYFDVYLVYYKPLPPEPIIYIEPTNLIFIEDSSGMHDMNLFKDKALTPPQDFEIHNEGGEDLEIIAMTRRDGDLWLDFSPSAPLTIAPGESETITVSVIWSLADTGHNDDRIMIESNDEDMSPYPSGVYVTAHKAPPPVSITLTPDTTTVPRGGTLGYGVTVTNETDRTQIVRYWTNVTLPNSVIYPPTGELFGPYTLFLKRHESRSAHLSHNIPMAAPLGDYVYNAYVGNYPPVMNEEHFGFTVTATTRATGAGQWNTVIDRGFNEDN